MSDADWLKSIDSRLVGFEKRVGERFDKQDEKIDKLLLKDANQSGKISGASMVVSGLISILISAIALYVNKGL